MILYLAIDDTDDIESKGTGDIAEEIAALIQEENLGETSSVTRHQLYIHDDIPYTSHNSSMCFIISDVLEDNYNKIIKLASEYLLKESSELSDPGLCICNVENVDIVSLIKYGYQAKTEVLSKQYAYDFSKKHFIFLNEYGGTGDGVIGALAGIGLRLSGNDGRFKGKHKIDDGNYTIQKLLENTTIEKVYDITNDKYLEDETINLSGKIKSVLLHNQRVLPVFIKDNQYINCTKELLRKY
jgi:hypothetical protein